MLCICGIIKKLEYEHARTWSTDVFQRNYLTEKTLLTHFGQIQMFLLAPFITILKEKIKNKKRSVSYDYPLIWR